MNNTIDFIDYLRDSLRDPEEAQGFLEVVLEEYKNHKDTDSFLQALRIIVEAQGGILNLAQHLHLGRNDFYDTLRENSHLKPAAINTILHELGFKPSVKPTKNHDHHVTH